mgnify:CR=1 FL=1
MVKLNHCQGPSTSIHEVLQRNAVVLIHVWEEGRNAHRGTIVVDFEINVLGFYLEVALFHQV